MKREEVQQKMEIFLGYMREEKDLRDMLASLEFVADNEAALQKIIAEQKSILRRIEQLHQEKMLPLITEMAEFVALRQSQQNST